MTTHELAHQLLAREDVPVYHYDPSFAPTREDEASFSDPLLIVYNAPQWRSRWPSFALIHGAQDGVTEREELADLRADARRVDWLLNCLYYHGTGGLTGHIHWEAGTKPERADIDAAMERLPMRDA